MGADGEVERIALVGAVSSLAAVSEDALSALLEEEERGEEGKGGEEGVVLCEEWLDVGRMPQSKLKALVLCSIARVMDPSLGVFDGPDEGDGAISRIRYVPSSRMSAKLFRCFGRVNNNGRDTPETLLLNFAKSPFVEVRLAAYELMRAFVSNVDAGATVLLSQVGFLELLLSCERETVKEGKEAKFAIVRAVLTSAARELLADKVVQDLERVLMEGPYRVASVNWQLATAEQ